MELRVLKGQQLIDSDLLEQIIHLDRKHMQSIMDQAGIDFPREKRLKGLPSATFVIAFDGQTIAGYLEYLRSWNNPDYIYIGSVQIEKRYRGSGLLLELFDRFRKLVATEEFTGFETSVQKVNEAAAKLYQKIGFKLENNPANSASWVARAGKELLTESPIAVLVNRWCSRRQS